VKTRGGLELVKWQGGEFSRKWLIMRGKFSRPTLRVVSMKSGKLEAFIGNHLDQRRNEVFPV
jgi:hypothetical protein